MREKRRLRKRYIAECLICPVLEVLPSSHLSGARGLLEMEGWQPIGPWTYHCPVCATRLAKLRDRLGLTEEQ